MRPNRFLSVLTAAVLAAAAAAAAAAALAMAPPALAAKTAKPAGAAAAESGGTSDAGATIYLVVNDTPITAYSVEQRIKLLSLDSGGGGGWQQRLQAKLHAPDLNARFKAFAIARNPKSREEVQALQRVFVESLRQQAIAEAKPGLSDRAVAELVNETLQMQAAKHDSVLATDDELNDAVTNIAKRNKKTLKEFQTAISATGINFRAFGQRIRAQMSWQREVEFHFRGQIVVGKAELEQELAASAAGAAGGGSEAATLKLQRIVLALKSGDAKASVAAYAAADELRQRAKPCSNFADLAAATPGARFEDMGSVATDRLAPEVRPILASADAGSVPPPILTKAGVEIYGVCERATAQTGASSNATAAAKDKIERQKLDARSHALLSDLCAAASIEPRNGFKLVKACGTE